MKFSRLAQVYDRISKAHNDSERVRLLAGLFKGADMPTLEAVAHFTASEVVDPRLSDKLGIGPGTIRAAVAEIAGVDEGEIETEVKRTGDMSVIVAAHARGRDTMTVDELWQRTNRMVKRDEDRLKLIEHVFTHTTPGGAKYFTRMVLNQMRIGVGLSTLARAIGLAFEVDAAAVEHLYAMSNDIGLAAVRASRGQKSLQRAGLKLFRPYQFMNAHKVDDAEEIFTRLSGKKIIFEIKYDGARLQIHIKAGRRPEIRLYS
ncbi:MAG: hypothetical protein LC731_06685, partial [Acidobacteria bacterium]|nr:hypothetical protein [Acidobacteriota bacterium]